MSSIRGRLTYANVMATIAVFGVLAGGGAWAASRIGASDILRNAVRSSAIKNNTVVSRDIRNGGVRLPDLSNPTIDAVAHGCEGDDPNDVMVRAGAVCIDKYEASVWSRPNGGRQYGVKGDDYPCNHNGRDCKGKIYARSVKGVPPSRFITWFQAQQALANSGKRLPTNAEWQQAVAGTSDFPGNADAPPDCNLQESVADTGSFFDCSSRWGARDMVGNVAEWVADWVPRWHQLPDCGGWSSSFTDDYGCTHDAVVRGSGPNFGSPGADDAGPFAILELYSPDESHPVIGFRGAR
jgi:formylglycine-generating enzyme required for sulfatase activity